MVAPPNAPVRIPTSVMPTCTVDKKCSGLLANSNATFALEFPSSTICWRRAFLADIIAISESAKIPFKRMSKKMIKISKYIDNL